MAFAGCLGVSIDLTRLAATSGISNDAVLLFSESNTRFLIEVPEANIAQLASHFADLPLLEIGQVTSWNRCEVRGSQGTSVIASDLEDLRESWKKPLAW